ncbi:unnamed protein product [Rotaria sordida]|uniref:Uncharacterized protein n=1 Tax=Rotaria sordida TaxID=392033 RepID=A0A815TS65_9BILA|nr:unnamed protein product [Rotaria sordida]
MLQHSVVTREGTSSALETRTREINTDTERLHQRLRDIAQTVLNDDDDQFDGNDFGRTSPRRLSPLRGADRFDSPERNYSRLRSPRSNSPQRPTQASRPHSRNVSPSFADSTFSAVQAALNKRQVQIPLRWKPNNHLTERGGVPI